MSSWIVPGMRAPSITGLHVALGRHSELSRKVPPLLTPFSHKKDPDLDSECTPSRSDTPSIWSYLLTPVTNRQFYKTASAEIAPCDIIIAPLLGRARDSGDAVAGGYHLRVPQRSQNRDFFTPHGEKSIANHTKTPR